MLNIWVGLRESITSTQASTARLLIPDTKRKLQPCSMVYYNDAAWLAQPGMALVHPSIDVDLAKAVGV